MGETIRLNDGTIYNESHAILAGDNLFIYICDGSGVREVFDDFIDPEKTEKIKTTRYGIDETYEGYTHLKGISEDSDTQVSIYLTKG